jgi:hypothetical protein
MPARRLKEIIQDALRSTGYVLVRKENFIDRQRVYDQDGLTSMHNHSFRQEPGFHASYQRGLQAARGVDPRHHWRVHTALWAAQLATSTEGDFVECGVNAGFMSSAIMTGLNWNSLQRQFFLVDTFCGPPLAQFNSTETANGLQAEAEKALSRGGYVTDMERIASNFAEWPAAVLVQGAVPQVLAQVPTSQVAFLHLDMNAASPEQAALEHFWPMLPAGGVVLMDDYAFCGYEEQHRAINELGEKLGFSALSLPTGQGLIIKPPAVAPAAVQRQQHTADAA